MKLLLLVLGLWGALVLSPVVEAYCTGLGPEVGPELTAVWSDVLKDNILHDDQKILAAVCVDAAQNFAYVGRVRGFPSAFSEDMYVTVNDANGNELWTRIVNFNSETALGCAFDKQGNLYVTGYVNQGLNFVDIYAGGWDAFLFKYDPLGELEWVREYGNSWDDFGLVVDTDLYGNVFVYGQSSNGAMPGGVAQGGQDIWVMKVDPETGDRVWLTQFGSPSTDYGVYCYSSTLCLNHNSPYYAMDYSTFPSRNMAVTSAGEIVATYSSSYPHAGFTSDNWDVYVIKLDSEGRQQWIRQIKSTGIQVSSGVAVDLKGNIYVTGSTQGILGGQPLPGGTDVFVQKFLPEGITDWVKIIGNSQPQYAGPIAVDAVGGVYVTFTNFDNSIDGLPELLSPKLAFLAGALIAKLDSTGTRRWTKQMSSCYDVHCESYSVSNNAPWYSPWMRFTDINVSRDGSSILVAGMYTGQFKEANAVIPNNNCNWQYYYDYNSLVIKYEQTTSCATDDVPAILDEVDTLYASL